MLDASDKFRLHGSPRTRKLLSLASGLLAAAAMVSVLFGSNSAFVSFLSGAGALWALSKRIELPDVACTFCRKSRREVDLMVAGPAASMCDECATITMEVLSEESVAKKDSRWIKRMISALPLRCPLAISTPLFKASVATHKAQILELVRRAFRLGNDAAGVELLERLPVAERDGADWVNLDCALERLERFDEALAALEHVAGDPEHEPWLLNNRASIRLGAEPCTEPVLRQLLADNLRARELLTQRKPLGFEYSCAQMWATAAELHRRLGERDEVLRCAKQSEALSKPVVDLLLTLAELAHSESRHAEAAGFLNRALETAHPESKSALKASRFLAEWPTA